MFAPQFSHPRTPGYPSFKPMNSNPYPDMFEQLKNQSNELFSRNGYRPCIISDEISIDDVLQNAEKLMQNQQYGEQLVNEILMKEDEVKEFFKKCEMEKQSLKEEKNSIIDDLIVELKRRRNEGKISNEDFYQIRYEWNKKRVETNEEKQRREQEERMEDLEYSMMMKYDEMKQTLLDIQNEKEKLDEERMQLNEERRLFREEMENEKAQKQSLQPDINELSSMFVPKEHYLALVNSYNALVIQHNEMMENYVKRNEIVDDCFIDQCNLPENEKKQLEEWSSMKCSKILFDSDIDNWSENTSILNERIIGKKQLIFLIEDTDGEKFGYYLNTEVIEEYGQSIQTDEKSFQFNLQSQNNRLNQPMKFEIKDVTKGGYILYDSSFNNLICLGNISVFKENVKDESHCWQNNEHFDYHGIDKALCGKEGYFENELFTPKRIIVIQMR